MGKKVKLTDACEFQGGSQPPKNQWINRSEEGYVRMLQIRDFTQKNVLTEYVKLTNTTKLCESSDILIARYGASVGKILTGLKGAYNVAIMKTIPDEKVLLKKYLYYYLNSTEFQQIIKNVGSRAAQAGFNKEDLANIEIYLPKIEAQRKIIKVLEKAEKALGKRKEAIRLLDELVKSQFIEMFGDPNTNTKGWNLKKFADICENKDSNRIPLKQSDRDKRHGEYPYYGATGIIDYIDEHIFEGLHLLIAEDGKNLETKNKDIAFLAQDKFWVNNHAHVVVETSESNLYYLKYVINNISLKPYITGIDQLKLNRSNLDSIVINVPPIELQNQFAEFVNQVDSRVDLHLTM